MLSLVKRGDIPHNCKELQEYDDDAHRMKSFKESFYLTSESFNINCYLKKAQLRRDHSHRIADIERAKYVIRFEVQCKYDKTFREKEAIKRNLFGMEKCNYSIAKELLSNLKTIPTAVHYFEKVITTGDYYPLKTAIAMVEARYYRQPRRERIIATLKLVSKHKSIARARTYCTTEQTDDQEGLLIVGDFNLSLQNLVGIGINPVTIPRRWKIKHIPNLLTRYKEMVESGELR